jgi:hypothetical protein
MEILVLACTPFLPPRRRLKRSKQTFQTVEASGDRSIHDVFEELTTAVAAFKRITFKR